MSKINIGDIIIFYPDTVPSLVLSFTERQGVVTCITYYEEFHTTRTGWRISDIRAESPVTAERVLDKNIISYWMPILKFYALLEGFDAQI